MTVSDYWVRGPQQGPEKKKKAQSSLRGTVNRGQGGNGKTAKLNYLLEKSTELMGRLLKKGHTFEKSRKDVAFPSEAGRVRKSAFERIVMNQKKGFIRSWEKKRIKQRVCKKKGHNTSEGLSRERSWKFLIMRGH